VLQSLNVPFVEADDEAAFYGPKVDVQFRSVIGREETMSTIQLDFAAKERFGLSYIDATGKENKEVFVIHRAPLSVHERFLAFLIEHYAGAFPVWLSPLQAVIIPISQDQNEYGQKILDSLSAANIRAELWNEAESMQKKIRKAEKQKIPYMLVVGKNEVDSKQLAVRGRGEKNLGSMPPDQFSAKVLEEINNKTLG
jgi:threonyl-tRNA synthetase